MKGRIHHIKTNIIKSIFAALLFFMPSINSFAENEVDEYNIKAMFVLNFMKYVEWPTEVNNDLFKIGVVGESELFNSLQNMTNNRNEKSKIKIEKATLDENGEYQILIISKSENGKTEEWTKRYQGKGVLIISEECKNSNNSAINIKTIKKKIRFEINNTQAKLGGIKISSRLADLAILVQP